MNKGIIYILIATLSFAIMNVMAKHLSDLHPMQIIFFRTLGTLVFILPYMIYRKVPIIGNHPKLLSARAIVGLISLATYFTAIQRIPLGSAISIRYIGPIFGAVLAYFFLKEKVNKWQWLSFVVAFAGVIMVKGFDIRVDNIGLMLSLISAFFIGFVFVLIKYLSSREHYLTIINYFMVISLVFSLFFISEWQIPDSSLWVSVILIGVFGLIGQVFMTRSFIFADASVLPPFKYMEIVYAIVMGYIFFGEGYTMLSLSGILIIVMGMVLNVLFKGKPTIKP